MTRGRGIARFFVHTVTVEPSTGQGGNGKDTFGPPVAVIGWLEESTRVIRGTDDEQVISSARFYTDAGNAALFPLNSRVTTATRSARVLLANANTSGALTLPDHLVVDLT